MTQDKKKHHFVPKSYLKGFVIEGQKSLIWEYDKKYVRISKNPKSIRKICCRDYYYEQTNDDGQKTQILEDGLGKIESKAIEIINNIYEHNVSITGEERLSNLFSVNFLLA